MFIIFEKKLEMFYLLSIKEVSLVFTFWTEMDRVSVWFLDFHFQTFISMNRAELS